MHAGLRTLRDTDDDVPHRRSELELADV